ncbi:SUMF1/EgtB/PvdO family nonheme iron enzyme [Paracoccus sp. SCN 68-21]|uniref:SUMF1/EgtB/PvdO family nonheme iron enzyme n=1 Tax=Paracoccus sp. SCN 68-21 TaxID=1660154 RepID=UPI00086EE60E|nr:SUMF1/EgtB/PvdO family nonheme iron enzyme [Paracoccus sp. SCN 68-21]ODT58431.1 MAG: nitrate reductase [Paracoccus sp. SCN 68-21]
MKLGMLLTAAVAVPAIALAVYSLAPAPGPASTTTLAAPATVKVDPGILAYRLPGEFLKGQHPVDGPAEDVRFRRPFEIMAYQVSDGDYALCVADGACTPPEGSGETTGNLPATGVSFRDAVAYAEWLSARTGENWRLPTDEEWAFAAAERYADDKLGIEDDANPATRWLARYRSEAAAASGRDPQPKPHGHFGANSNGIYDLSGNVWEWTTTCYRRASLDADGRVEVSTDNCGVRVVGGKHRGYMSFFIRDGKSGGCAGGMAPDNLGIRLVKERPSLLAAFRTLWRKASG